MPAQTPNSLRVPVQRVNRDYLRALRAAELAAWQAKEVRVPGITTTGFRTLREAAAEDRRRQSRETWVLAFLSTVAFGAVAWGMSNSLRLTEHWAQFSQAVGRLLG